MKNKFAIVTAEYKEIHSSLNKFKNEKAAQDKLNDLVNRGVIYGIPVKILEYNPKDSFVNKDLTK